MPSGWNPGAGTAAITPTLAYGKYGSPNNAMVVLVLPTGRTSAYRLSRERSSLERQDVAVLANEVRASDRMSPFSRTKFAQATGCRRSRERSSRKRQDVAVLANEVRASDRMSPFSRTKF